MSYIIKPTEHTVIINVIININIDLDKNIYNGIFERLKETERRRRKQKERATIIIVGCSPGLTRPTITLYTPRQNKRRVGTACSVIPFAQYFDCYLAVGVNATASSDS